MFKKNKLLFTVLTLIICMTMIFTLFACDKDENPAEEEEQTSSEDLLVSNGDFLGVSADDETYPKAPNKWTATPGSSSSNSELKTPSDSDSVEKGVVDVKNFTISSTGTPGKADDSFDNKVLMINNKKATSYAYLSESISLSKKSYYRLTLYVKTVGIEAKNAGDENAGACIMVSGDAYAELKGINTNDNWVKKTLYFRTSDANNSSIRLSLGNGNGNSKYGSLTKGYVYYDQVILENLTDVEEGQTAFTEAQFNALEETNDQVKIDCRTINKTFDYSSTQNTDIFTPAQLTGKGGKGSGTDASTGSTYVEKGIIDTIINPTYKFAGYSDDPIAVDPVAGSKGNRMLCISNLKSTAYGYKDTLGFNIEKDKYYKITTKVKTLIGEGKGAFVRLVNSSSEELAMVSEINTSGTWATVEFYVQAHAYTTNTLNIEYWNGFGGSGDGKWTTGVAFFDELTYEAIDKATYDAASVSALVGKYSYATPEGTLIDMTSSLMASTQYEESLKINTETSIVNTKEAGAFVASDGTAYNTLKIDNKKPNAFTMSSIYKKDGTDNEVDETNKDLFKILPNTAYELTLWVKTTNLDKASSATINLISYDTKKNKEYDKATSTLQSISSINSATMEDYVDENHAGYTRYTIYVLGGEKDTVYAGLSVVFGTGTNSMQSTSFVMGQLYISNIRMQQIPYSEYSSASTTSVVFKKSLGGSGNSGEISSNGNFTLIDVSATSTLYKDKLDTVWNSNQQLIGTAVPQNWSCTNTADLKASDDTKPSIAGVIDVNYYNLASIESYLTKDNIYQTMSHTMDSTKYPNLLYIKAENTTSIGYKSNSISLDAKSYYLVTVYAKVVSGTMSIDIARTNSTNTSLSAAQYTAAQVGNDWNLYSFYIKTGVTSSTINVGLYAGYPGNTNPDSNVNSVLFTQASYTAISENVYNNAIQSVKDADPSDTSSIQYRTKYENYTYTVDTMDSASSTTTDELVAPQNWTGALVDSSASTKADDLSNGIFSQTQSDWSIVDINPDTDNFVKDSLFKDPSKTGDSVLVIYNKKDNSYGYTSNSFTLKAEKYYKVSIDVLVKDLKYVDPDSVDTSVEEYKKWVNKKLYETATITLTINNKTYTFGKSLAKEQPTFEDTEEGKLAKNAYLADVDRLVNNSNGWTTYTYYIAVDKDVTESMSATLKISLGGKNVSYWQSGYVFMDNFSVEDISDETAFNAAAPADNVVTYGQEGYDKNVASNTFKIKFTAEDATAEAEAEETEEETTQENPAKNWMWLYITSGVIGGVMVIVLVIFIIKKYAPKGGKKFKKAKKTTISNDSTRGKFSN